MAAPPASTAGSSPRDGGGDAVPAASVAGLGPPLKEGLLYRESTVVPGIAKKRHAVLYSDRFCTRTKADDPASGYGRVWHLTPACRLSPLTPRRYSALSTRQHHALWALLTGGAEDRELWRFGLASGDGGVAAFACDSAAEAEAWHGALAAALARLNGGVAPPLVDGGGGPTVTDTPKAGREGGRGWRGRGRSIGRDDDLVRGGGGGGGAPDAAAHTAPAVRTNSASQLEADLTRTLQAAADAAAARRAAAPPGVTVEPASPSAGGGGGADPVGLTPWYTEDGVTVYVGRDADGDDVLVESFVVRAPPRLCASTLLRSEVDGGTAFGPDPPSLLRVVDAHTQYLGVRWRPAGVVGGLLAAPRDLILKRTWRRDDDGQYVVLYTSADGEVGAGAAAAAAAAAAHRRPAGVLPAVRGRVLSSGYTFAPLLPEYDPARACGETLVTHVAKLDAGGALAALRAAGPLGRALAAPAWGALLLPLARRSIALKNQAEAERFVARPFLAGNRSATQPPSGVSDDGGGARAAAAARAASLAQTRSIFRRSPSAAGGARGVGPADGVAATLLPASPPRPGAPAPFTASPSLAARAAAADAAGTMLPAFWSCPGAAGFKVRGPSYLDDHRKVDAGEPMLSLAAVDLLDLDAPTFNVARFLPSVTRSPAPFLFVVNLMIPGPTPHSVVISWAADRAAPVVPGGGDGDATSLERAESVAPPRAAPPAGGGAPTPFAAPAAQRAPPAPFDADDPPISSPFDLALARFLAGGDSPDANARRDGTFKLIPRVTEGSWIVKQSVGTTPCLLGHKLAQRYSRGPNYFEVDVDVASSSVASTVVGLVMGATKSVVVDMAIVMEGHARDELPEALLGTVRLARVDMGTGRFLETATGRLWPPGERPAAAGGQ